MGDVDYRLLTAFVKAKRANADARAGKRDVEELLAVLEERVRSQRSTKPVGDGPPTLPRWGSSTASTPGPSTAG